MPDPAITTTSLTKSFRGGIVAVDDLDLEVRHGEVFGFIGPNGAGKTTTIRLLLDLIRPTSGEVRVLGLDPRKRGAEARAQIGYLPGELHLDERLNARETFTWIGRLRGQDVETRALELAEQFELPLERRLRDLSKGNKQKVGLIQAVMHEPQLVILDEPTSGLDPLLQRLFVELAHQMIDRGVTLFISSHVLSELEHVADRVAMIRDGRLIAVQSIGELKRHSAHRVAIRFARDVPADLFDGMAGVDEVQIKGTLARLRVRGEMDAVVKKAAVYEVLDLTSVEPDLEEIFLSYYDGDQRPGGNDA